MKWKIFMPAQFLTMLVLLLSLATGLLIQNVPLQYLVFGVALLLCLHLTNYQLLYMSVVLVCVTGLLRRLLAGELGRVDGDPVILLPLVFTAIVVIRTLLEPRSTILRPKIANLSYGMAGLSCVTFVLSPQFTISAIYPSVLTATIWIYIGLQCSGRVPDLWPAIYKTFPFIGLVIGGYGVYQFFALPSWDRAWMVASKLSSIGAPVPEQVRVFGTAESPGPFAIILGLCLIVSLERSISQKGLQRIAMAAIACLLLLPLSLTAVRTGLLGLVLAGAFMSFWCLRGARRLIPLAATVLCYVVLTLIIERFGNNSSVLSSDRLSEFDAGNDNSLQRRLLLFGDIARYVVNPFGRGIDVNSATGQPSSADNAFIDILARNGPIVAILLVILVLAVLKACFRIDRASGYAVGAAACGIYLVFFMIASNIFASGTGLLCAVVFGSLLRYECDRIKSDSAVDNGGKVMTSTRLAQS
ncbi:MULTISPECIES: hypothetical protein [Nocardiaceae]|uniref:hypothetical protein n=1 Tax=Nocardiaceae TaxID=85025 RepID=UPI00114019A6|nr:MULTISPECIES: hypothetical protein [Rhodococcus]